MPVASTTISWFWLTGIDVLGSHSSRAVVACRFLHGWNSECTRLDHLRLLDKRIRSHCSIAGKRGDQGADLQVCSAKNKSSSKISFVLDMHNTSAKIQLLCKHGEREWGLLFCEP
jgi:hypothetical protein